MRDEEASSKYEDKVISGIPALIPFLARFSKARFSTLALALDRCTLTLVGTEHSGRPAVAMGALVALAVACGSEGPCDFTKGANLTITILGPAYPAQTGDGQTSCGAGFNLSSGLTFDATVGAYAGDDTGTCYDAIPSYGPVGQWTWNLNTPYVGGVWPLQGSYDATNGVCHGRVFVQLEQGGSFGASVPWVLERAFAALEEDASVGGANCPSSCEDTFPANVQQE